MKILIPLMILVITGCGSQPGKKKKAKSNQDQTELVEQEALDSEETDTTTAGGKTEKLIRKKAPNGKEVIIADESLLEDEGTLTAEEIFEDDDNQAIIVALKDQGCALYEVGELDCPVPDETAAMDQMLIDLTYLDLSLQEDESVILPEIVATNLSESVQEEMIKIIELSEDENISNRVVVLPAFNPYAH